MDNEQEIIKLGIVGIKNMGVYDADTNYEKLNVVTYQGSTYCALRNTQGNLPTDTNYWQLYAQKGGIGPQGTKPVKGVDYYTSDDKEEIEEDLATDIQENVHNEVIEQIGNISNGNPLPAQTLADMTDTTRLYVLVTDGYVYYYDGNDWVQGWIYQSTGIANKVIEYKHLSDELNHNFEADYTSIGTVTTGKYQPRQVDYGLSDSANYKVITVQDLIPGNKIYITCKIATSASLDAITFFGSDNKRVQHPTPAPYDLEYEEYTIPANATFAVINCHKDYDIGAYIRTYNIIDKSTKPFLYNLDDVTLNRLSNKQFGSLSKGYVCFVTDDGHDELITNTLPIIQAKNVPFTFACWTDSDVISDSTKRQQIINAINNYGCAVCQHGNQTFRNYTKQELYDYLISEQEKWIELGIDVNGLCYPNHDHDKAIMAIAGSIFNVCATGGPISGQYTGTKVIYPNETNGERTNMYELYRVSLSSHNLNQLKASVDYAYENNKVLILFAHDNNVTGDVATKINDIIDYTKQVGITFTTINDLDKII